MVKAPEFKWYRPYIARSPGRIITEGPKLLAPFSGDKEAHIDRCVKAMGLLAKELDNGTVSDVQSLKDTMSDVMNELPYLMYFYIDHPDWSLRDLLELFVRLYKKLRKKLGKNQVQELYPNYGWWVDELLDARQPVDEKEAKKLGVKPVKPKLRWLFAEAGNTAAPTCFLRGKYFDTKYNKPVESNTQVYLTDKLISDFNAQYIGSYGMSATPTREVVINVLYDMLERLNDISEVETAPRIKPGFAYRDKPLGRRDPDSNVGCVCVNDAALALNLYAVAGDDRSDFGVSVGGEIIIP